MDIVIKLMYFIFGLLKTSLTSQFFIGSAGPSQES